MGCGRSKDAGGVRGAGPRGIPSVRGVHVLVNPIGSALAPVRASPEGTPQRGRLPLSRAAVVHLASPDVTSPEQVPPASQRNLLPPPRSVPRAGPVPNDTRPPDQIIASPPTIAMLAAARSPSPAPKPPSFVPRKPSASPAAIVPSTQDPVKTSGLLQVPTRAPSIPKAPPAHVRGSQIAANLAPVVDPPAREIRSEGGRSISVPKRPTHAAAAEPTDLEMPFDLPVYYPRATSGAPADVNASVVDADAVFSAEAARRSQVAINHQPFTTNLDYQIAVPRDAFEGRSEGAAPRDGDGACSAAQACETSSASSPPQPVAAVAVSTREVPLEDIPAEAGAHPSGGGDTSSALEDKTNLSRSSEHENAPNEPKSLTLDVSALAAAPIDASGALRNAVLPPPPQYITTTFAEEMEGSDDDDNFALVARDSMYFPADAEEDADEAVWKKWAASSAIPSPRNPADLRLALQKATAEGGDVAIDWGFWNLQPNELVGLQVAVSCGPREFRWVTSLRLSGNPRFGEQLADFMDVLVVANVAHPAQPVLPSLRELHLSDVALVPHVFEAVLRAMLPPSGSGQPVLFGQLAVLNVSANPLLGAKGAGVLVQVLSGARDAGRVLQKLDLSKCHLGPAGGEVLLHYYEDVARRRRPGVSICEVGLAGNNVGKNICSQLVLASGMNVKLYF